MKTLEQKSEYYAHNNFNMHDTNNYQALKKGFTEGYKQAQIDIIKELENTHILSSELENLKKNIK